MDWREYQAYRVWMNRWLPTILTGEAPSDDGASDASNLASLPGGEIVKAY